MRWTKPPQGNTTRQQRRQLAKIERRLGRLIPLAQAGFLFPDDPHPSTVYRWAKYGKRGVKLRVWLAGKTLATTAEAVALFIFRLSQTREPDATFVDGGDEAQAGERLRATVFRRRSNGLSSKAGASPCGTSGVRPEGLHHET